MFRVLQGLLVLLLLVPLVVRAEAPVWRVSDGDSQLFIGGTIHVLEAQDYPLPEAFDRAYAASEIVVLETDLDQAGSPGFQQRLLEAAMYADGSTLADRLSPATLERLRGFAEERGLPIEALLPFRVGMLVTLLTMDELARLGIQGTGVDGHFRLRAGSDRKPLLALESLDEQIRFITRMGEGQEDAMVRRTLEELTHLEQAFRVLKNAWRDGDSAQLEAIGLEEFEAFPDIYTSMLVNRNRAWLQRIETMFRSEEVEFVLVGVLHLVGPDSLLAMLVENGYAVEPYP